MRYAFAALMGLILAAVQETPADDLVRKLNDDAIEVREQAEADLIQQGPAALAALKGALENASPEVRLRARRAIEAIDRAEQMKGNLRAPARVTLAAEGQEVAAILDQLSKTCGFAVETVGVPKGTASLNVADAPLFQALDALAKSLNKSYAMEKGRLSWKDKPFAPCPAVYPDALRVALTRVEVKRTETFDKRSIELTLDLRVMHEACRTPSRLEVTIAGIVDGEGKALELARETEAEDAMGGIRIAQGIAMGGWAGVMGAGNEETEPAPWTFTFKGLSPAATVLRSIKGVVKMHFALAPSDVVFDEPKEGSKQEAGDYTVEVKKDLANNPWGGAAQPESPPTLYLNFGWHDEKAGQERDLSGELKERFDTSSVVAIDAEGKEHKADKVEPIQGMGNMAQIQIVVGVGGGGKGGKQVVKSFGPSTYAVTFKGMALSDIKQMKFKLSKSTGEHPVEFELKDIPLP